MDGRGREAFATSAGSRWKSSVALGTGSLVHISKHVMESHAGSKHCTDAVRLRERERERE